LVRQSRANDAKIDAKALYQALDRERTSRGLTCQDLSGQIGVSASAMQRLSHGGRLEVDSMLAMVSWLGRSVESFVRQSKF
jgi:transcriptional regulator with XRE-family HTH domain